MKKLGHLGLAMLLAAPISYGIYYFGFESSAVVFPIVVGLTCNLPDVDGKLQRMTGKNGYPIIRDIFSITHRGRFHTVFFGIIVGLVSGSLTFSLSTGVTSIGVTGLFGGFSGVLFHLFGDVVTPTGINFAPPITGNYSFDLFRFDNLVANFGFGLIGLMSLGIFLALATNPSLMFVLGVLFVYGVGVPLIILCASNVDIRYGGSSKSLFRSPFTIKFWVVLVRKIL